MTRIILFILCALLLAGCGIYVVDRPGVRGIVVGPKEPPRDTVFVPCPECQQTDFHEAESLEVLSPPRRIP
jgi:hypothetical protein